MTSVDLPTYEPKYTFTTLESDTAVNVALCGVQDGVVGFDTEFCDPEQAGGDTTSEDDRACDQWTTAKLCVVQVATPSEVFIIPVKQIKAFPVELRRVLESDYIIKAGVGFPIDGKIVFDAVGVQMRNLVDVGLLTKFSNVGNYLDSDQTPLGLEHCVQDVLFHKLDKTMQKKRWDGKLTDAHRKYAGLDAQASLEVYNIVAPRTMAIAMTIPRGIPTDWYNFDCIAGKPKRREKSYDGRELPWSAKFCTWYQNGRFVGHNF
ncbi:ribonuclease H-like domain-containing protein [Mycena alexandri]|uniref:3'-5' exonuclease n=1 Tax=Mycena alexandri TaxID=1745969 RepID=A0AAD6X882_9AGAR|nr:ribonuclease H-like domain-containing protein [Mycena alexandri]